MPGMPTGPRRALRLALLEMKEVSKAFSKPQGFLPFRGRSRRHRRFIEAVVSVDLEVDKGEAVGLAGESGAGKSTLAAMAAGLTRPSAGRVVIDSLDERGGRRQRLRRARQVQLVWQDTRGSFDPRIKIGAAVGEPLRIHGIASGKSFDKKINLLLEEVGLASSHRERYPHELSGGQLQRAVIARALALNPGLLICDEPASSLDATHKLQITELLSRLRRNRGLALLVIAHDLALIRMLTQKINVMYKGRFVESGPTEDVLADPGHPYTKLLVRADPASPSWDMKLFGDTVALAAEVAPGGCIFAGGCPELEDGCQKVEPKLISAGAGRRIACLRKSTSPQLEPRKELK